LEEEEEAEAGATLRRASGGALRAVTMQCCCSVKQLFGCENSDAQRMKLATVGLLLSSKTIDHN
jgi:hypothetical protein